jgi:hypothetical protein
MRGAPWTNHSFSTETPKKSGARSKVCVTDYNGDGLVDFCLAISAMSNEAKVRLSQSLFFAKVAIQVALTA